MRRDGFGSAIALRVVLRVTALCVALFASAASAEDRVLTLADDPSLAGPEAGCGETCTPSPPLVVEGAEDVVVRDLAIAGADGDCLVVRASRRVVLERLTLSECGGAGVRVIGSAEVVVRAVAVADAVDSGVVVDGSEDVTVTESTVERAAAGVYAHASRGVAVRTNRFVDVQGRSPRGQGVQFDRIEGPGNAVSCNVVVSRPGRSAPEDAINLHRSGGTPTSPIDVSRNRILGGGPSPSGGGILVGDWGGAHVDVDANVLVDPGQYGIGIAGGTHMRVVDNAVVARAQPFTNVGIYVWNVVAEAGPCADHLLAGNQVDYTAADGTPNPLWVSDTCARVSADAALDETAAPLDPAALLREAAQACRP